MAWREEGPSSNILLRQCLAVYLALEPGKNKQTKKYRCGTKLTGGRRRSGCQSRVLDVLASLSTDTGEENVKHFIEELVQRVLCRKPSVVFLMAVARELLVLNYLPHTCRLYGKQTILENNFQLLNFDVVAVYVQFLLFLQPLPNPSRSLSKRLFLFFSSSENIAFISVIGQR